MDYLFFFWIIGALVISFFKFKLGLDLYIFYWLFVPFMGYDLGLFTVKWSTVCLLLLCAFLFYRMRKRKTNGIIIQPLFPFLLFFVILLLIMPFQKDVPFEFAFSGWKYQFIKFLILPFILINFSINNKILKHYRNLIMGCVLIIALYGFFLLFIPGSNPYISAISSNMNTSFDLSYIEPGAGRLFGRISSVFLHPMTYGIFLCMSIIYVLYNRYYIQKYYYFLLPLLIINILLCGVRSVIAALLITTFFFFLQVRKFKIILYIVSISCLFILILSFIPSLYSYVSSVFDINNTKGSVGGSSLEMRLTQFAGCLLEIYDCIWFGKGFEWHHYYQSLYGDHPILLAFESLIFMTLCDSGLCGVILWCSVFLYVVYNNNKFHGEKKIALNSFIICYLSYSCITGDYEYMQYFLLFYALTYISPENNEIRKYGK